MRAFTLSVLAAAAACGGGVKKPTGPVFTKGQKVRISDGGQIYDALNTTTCIAWPSPEVKHRAGRDGWNGWDPDTGIEGEVIAQLPHCDHHTQVVLVEVAGYVVPVTNAGIEDAKAEVGVEGGVVGGVVGGVYGGDPYGGDPYGGEYYDYDEEGGYYEGGGGGASGWVVGDSVRLLSATDGIYSKINEDDCLDWPNDDMKKAAGAGAWGSWTPSVDDICVIEHVTVNCHDEYDTVLVVDCGGHLVPVSSQYVEPSY